MKISVYRWEAARRAGKARIENGKCYIFLETEQRYLETEVGAVEISPLYGPLTVEAPWEGNCPRKPWDYEVTACIPSLNTSETLPICIELLRLQTLRPYIVIIDTGSVDEHLHATEALRADDVEVQVMRLNGVRHPSDYPAMAMDISFAVCRTEYLFATHADCFLRKRTLLEEMIEYCQTKSPALGYELSPRAHKDWKGMLSHTASMYHMPTMDRIGFGWSLRRLCNQHGIVDYKPDPMKPNWPDTEILGNYILKENGIVPHLIGTESNQQRTLDDNIDHFRSYTAGKMYSPPYWAIVKPWYESAVHDARERIERWRKEAKMEERS